MFEQRLLDDDDVGGEFVPRFSGLFSLVWLSRSLVIFWRVADTAKKRLMKVWGSETDYNSPTPPLSSINFAAVNRSLMPIPSITDISPLSSSFNNWPYNGKR